MPQQPGLRRQRGRTYWAGYPSTTPSATRHLQVLKRSSIPAMLHYYQRNYPRPPYPQTLPALPPLIVPVLMIHGLADIS